MTPDLLKAFQGLNQEARRQKLKDEGYEVLRRGNLCSVYHKPDSDVVLRISMRPATAELMSRCFANNTGNPYLPRVYAHETVAPDKHICAMEKLISLEELDEEGDDLVGQARALASFPFGDNLHVDVHKIFAMDKNLMAAVRALASCARESILNPSSNGECLSLERNVDGIMFRRENGMLHPVFVDTLIYTTPCQDIENQLDNVLSRMKNYDQDERRKAPALSGGPV
jgi:hypothetical protein